MIRADSPHEYQLVRAAMSGKSGANLVIFSPHNAQEFSDFAHCCV